MEQLLNNEQIFDRKFICFKTKNYKEIWVTSSGIIGKALDDWI